VFVWAAIVLGTLLVTEFYGYWLHYFLHSDKIRWLSSNHMWHHLHNYAPSKNQRPHKYYLSPGLNVRASLFGIGTEWLIPALLLIGFTVTIEYYVIGLTGLQTTISVSMMVLYSYFMFGWLHDTMHIKDHWLAKSRFTKRYFMYVRRLHDIHHHNIIDEGPNSGLLPYNLGISTPMFDKVFGTYLSHMRGKSRKQILTGYKAGLQRYKLDGENNEDNKETTTTTH